MRGYVGGGASDGAGSTDDWEMKRREWRALRQQLREGLQLLLLLSIMFLAVKTGN